MSQFVGDAAYECGNCRRVAKFPIFAVNSIHIGAPMCWCGGLQTVHQMYPINDLAKSNDEFREALYGEQARKARARKFMQEVNW